MLLFSHEMRRSVRVGGGRGWGEDGLGAPGLIGQITVKTKTEEGHKDRDMTLTETV